MDNHKEVRRETVRLLKFLSGRDPRSLPFQYHLILTLTYHLLGLLQNFLSIIPQPPLHINNLPHIPLQSIKDGGLHYIVPSRKFMEAFLLDFCIIFSLSIIILLLLVKIAMLFFH